MIACHVGDSSSDGSLVDTGSSSSSFATVSPGAGIGGSAMRATANVSLAGFVPTILPNGQAPAGNDATAARLRGPPRVAITSRSSTAAAPATLGAPNPSTPAGSGTANAA